MSRGKESASERRTRFSGREPVGGQVIEGVLVLMLLVLVMHVLDREGISVLFVLVGLVGYAIGLIDRREGPDVSVAGATKIPWLQQFVPWK
jgi:hypothetical protein